LSLPRLLIFGAIGASTFSPALYVCSRRSLCAGAVSSTPSEGLGKFHATATWQVSGFYYNFSMAHQIATPIGRVTASVCGYGSPSPMGIFVALASIPGCADEVRRQQETSRNPSSKRCRARTTDQIYKRPVKKTRIPAISAYMLRGIHIIVYDQAEAPAFTCRQLPGRSNRSIDSFVSLCGAV
jgi:hypothetical protein